MTWRKLKMFTHSYAAQWRRRIDLVLLLAATVIALSILSPLALAQTETVLYSFDYPTFTFTGCPPNSYNIYPHAGVVFREGRLFGTTPEGGIGEKGLPGSKDGIVFKLTPPKSGSAPWEKNTVHNFIPEPTTAPPPIDGIYPCSRLVLDDGVLYGTTLGGGSAGFGMVYALIPPTTGQWTETILYNFTGGTDGEAPYDGLLMDGSNIFGVSMGGSTNSNGSNVFELSSNGSGYTERTLLSNNAGDIYNGDLLLDVPTGSLFGTSQSGGAHGYGYVFALIPQGGGFTVSDIWDFTGGADGAHPNGGLAGRAGDLFGTTQGGGESIGCCGVLFELRQEIKGDPLYSEITWRTFSGAPSDGSIPVAGLYKDASGTLWGTTTIGGLDNMGTIFELYPDRTIVNDWHYGEVYSFTGGTADGANPQSLLTEDKSSNLYGTTNAGGSANEGTVFKFIP
jgi:uncharacterized repeat protein (TIGR03803 family)